MIAVRPCRPDHLGHGIRQSTEPQLTFGERGAIFLGRLALVAGGPARLQPRHCGGGEDLQAARLERRQPGARLIVDDAHRTERHAFTRDERCARVEADVRRTGDERVVDEARVPGGIGHFHYLMPVHGMRAEGL